MQSNGWKMIFHRSQLLVSHQTEELPANGAFLFPSGFGGERTRPPWRLPQICLRGRPPLPLTQDGLPERRAPHPGCRRGRNGRGLCCVRGNLAHSREILLPVPATRSRITLGACGSYLRLQEPPSCGFEAYSFSSVLLGLIFPFNILPSSALSAVFLNATHEVIYRFLLRTFFSLVLASLEKPRE